MADSTSPSANQTAASPAVSMESAVGTRGPDWEIEDAYWQSAYPERPYARADRNYEYYRSAYRYGFDAAMRHERREWSEVEHELRRRWAVDREGSDATWDEMKDAVRDAWDHVRGRSDDDRTHIR
jgi:hypothetical protein